MRISPPNLWHPKVQYFIGIIQRFQQIFQQKRSVRTALLFYWKLERKHRLSGCFCKYIPDYRHPLRTVHSMEKLLKQRVYMLIPVYEDANDVFHLQNGPLFKP